MKLGFFLLALSLCGCASSTLQTDALLLKPDHQFPQKYQIDGVPFIEQAAGHCGPATLTMALNALGKTVSVDEVAQQVYTPKMKGSFQADMISASRRQGMLAIPIQGLESLLSEVSAGRSVIVFENLAVSWLPQWHYAIVFGFDLREQIVLMHSGPEAFKRWDLRKFERSWKLAEYWGLLVLPPGELSVTADELSHLKATAGLEQLGNLEGAQTSYQKILERWPKSLGARIGLANIAYAQKKYSTAVQLLETAAVEHPESAVTWHNLAIAQGAAKRKSEARRSAHRALEKASPQEKLSFKENLKEWISSSKPL